MKDPVHNNIEKLGHTPHELSVLMKQCVVRHACSLFRVARYDILRRGFVGSSPSG
jgi:hypothetical protein